MKYNDKTKILSNSLEQEGYIDETIVIDIDNVVKDPRNEIIVRKIKSNEGKILVIYSGSKRRLITFQIIDGNYKNKNEITLWNILQVLRIRLNHRSVITAIKPCKHNIFYLIEINKGFVHYQSCNKDETEPSESKHNLSKNLEKGFKRKNDKKVDKHDGNEVLKEKTMSTKIKKLNPEEKLKKKGSTYKDGGHKKLDRDKKNKNSIKKDENVTKKLGEIELLDKIKPKVPASETPLIDSNSNSSVKVAYYLSSQGIPKFTFYMTDYKSLEEGQWLNDLIIDWYLTYLYERVISEEKRQKTFIYSSLFFAILRNDFSNAAGSLQGSDKKYSRVRRFVRDDVNIFDKDFIIMPVNEDNRHWYLMIICYPGLDKTDQILNASVFKDRENNFEKKIPRILVFDSLKTTPKYGDVWKVREYLRIEYYMKFGKHRSFSENEMKCDYPSIAMQKNFSDCGMFVLQFVERFFKDPTMDYVSPGKVQKWFSSTAVIKKRAQLVRMLQKMHQETLGKDTPVNLPKLKFPSLEIINKDPRFDYSSEESILND